MPKITALLAFRNEERYLPGFFAHLRNYVADFIVFDDNSSDDSAEIARSQPSTRLLSRRLAEPSPAHYFEVENRRALLNEAIARQAEWVLCCDADERHEQRFLENLQSITAAHQVAFGLKVRDLWDSKDQYRVDGPWGGKAKFVLFPVAPFSDYYPEHSLHRPWVPPSIKCSRENILDFNLYHLASLHAKNRVKRLRKFKTIDPGSQHQPVIGYDYLTNETTLRVEKIPVGRGFEILPEDSPLFA